MNFICASDFLVMKRPVRNMKKKNLKVNVDRKNDIISSVKDELQKYLELNLKKG